MSKRKNNDLLFTYVYCMGGVAWYVTLCTFCTKPLIMDNTFFMYIVFAKTYVGSTSQTMTMASILSYEWDITYTLISKNLIILVYVCCTTIILRFLWAILPIVIIRWNA